MIVNELRSDTIHEEFMAAFGQEFLIRKVPHSHMHAVYQHPALGIYILKKKRSQTNDKSIATGRDSASSSVADSSSLNGTNSGWDTWATKIKLNCCR